MELFKIKWYLEKRELKTAIHNKVFLLFSYLSEKLPELERILEKKIINNLGKLFELSKNHQEIGYKNPEGVWVSRRFSAESDLDQYINYRRELIEKGDFSESDYSHYDTETCISRTEEDIHKAEEEIERRKKIVEIVQSITHLCNLTIEELETSK